MKRLLNHKEYITTMAMKTDFPSCRTIRSVINKIQFYSKFYLTNLLYYHIIYLHSNIKISRL